MAEKINGWREALIGAVASVAPPTDFTSLGRLFPSDPSFQADVATDAQGYPLYKRTMFEWVIDLPDVSKRTVVNTYDGVDCNVALLGIADDYFLLKSVLCNNLVPTVRDGYQAARFRITAAPRDITTILPAMSATAGATLGTPAGTNVRGGFIKQIAFNTDGGLTWYSYFQIAEDITIGDDTPTQRYSSGKTRQLGQMARLGFTVLDADVFTILNAHQLANGLLDSFDIEFTDGTQINLSGVGFSAVPVFSGGIGTMRGCRIDLIGYSDALADYLVMAPAFT